MSYVDEVMADAPLAYYRLGETEGSTTMTDSSGNARDGFYVGAVTPGVAGLLAGDADTAADFAGGYAQVAYDAAWMAPATFSVEAVFRADTVTGQHPIVARHGNGKPSWELSIRGGVLRIYFHIGGAWNELAAPTNPTAGTTYHVVATFDGSTRQLYVNGALVASKASATFTASSVHLSVGRLESAVSADAFDGRIDEVAVYPSALPQSRVTAHHNAFTVDGTASLPGVACVPDVPTGKADGLALATLTGQIRRVALVSTAGDDTTPGVELSGGTYARAAPRWHTLTPSGWASSDIFAVASSMPATDVQGWEGWSADGATRVAYDLLSPTQGQAVAADDSVSVAPHRVGLTDGQKVVFRAGLAPPGLAANTTYFARDVTASTFRVAATAGGAALEVTADGPVYFGTVYTATAGQVLRASVGVHCSTPPWS
jgi:hypothetical protein